MELILSIGIVLAFIVGFIIGNAQRRKVITAVYLKGGKDGIAAVSRHYEFVPKDKTDDRTVGFKLN